MTLEGFKRTFAKLISSNKDNYSVRRGKVAEAMTAL